MISSALKTPSWSSIRYRLWSERCVCDGPYPPTIVPFPKRTKMPVKMGFFDLFAPKKRKPPKLSIFRGAKHVFVDFRNGLVYRVRVDETNLINKYQCPAGPTTLEDEIKRMPPWIVDEIYFLQKNTGIQRSCESKTIHASQRLFSNDSPWNWHWQFAHHYFKIIACSKRLLNWWSERTPKVSIQHTYPPWN